MLISFGKNTFNWKVIKNPLLHVDENKLLLKAGIVSGLFMEEFEKNFLMPPKTEDFLIYKTSTKDVEKDLTPFMKNYVNTMSILNGHQRIR